MKRRLLFVSSVIAIVLSVGGMAAWAQNSGAVKIPFVFTAGDKELPAGQYTIRPNANGNGLTVINLDTNVTVIVPVLTRLSARPGKSVQMVFDKTEDKSFLTEVYFPGMDGFHLQGAPGKHAHTKVEGN